MLCTGFLSARFGSKPIVLAGAMGMAITLPLLSVMNTSATLGMILLLFGASLGSLDVAMNIHAVEVERAANRPLMSGFHGLYSVGGFAGSGVVTALLSSGLGLGWSTALCSALMVVAICIAWPLLLKAIASEPGPLSVWPRGVVVLLAVLTGITFLAEGAVLDWGALLLTEKQLVAAAQGGSGYFSFSLAMTVGRLCGDWIVGHTGDRAVLRFGGLLAMSGFLLVGCAHRVSIAMIGFVVIGFGASNIVPVLFRHAGSQTQMPPRLAVAAISTVGYAGVLAGPAAIGFVARQTGLPIAFGLLTALFALVALTAGRVVNGR
jgi:fucose permease